MYCFIYFIICCTENLSVFLCVLLYLLALKIDYNFGGECEGNVGEFSTSSLTCPAIYKITCDDVINGISDK